ncbi:MAG: DUF3108 domain-containing protein [Acetobacteraceae bacterium]|jgi:hypothetical protein
MKPATSLIALLCLTSPLAVHRAIAEQLNYTLHVVGIPVADAALTINTTGSAYRAVMRFHTTGLANLVDGSSLEEAVSGEIKNDRPAPQVYSSNGYLHGQNRIVDMTWQDGSPVATAITPPNATERADVPVALRAGTVDQVSLIILLVHLAQQTGGCEAAARSYDGRDLQLFQVRTAGEEELPASGRSSFSGRALRCDFTSQTLAGFRFGSGGEQDHRSHRGTIWLGQVVPGGPRLPVQAAVETRWFGDATIYLTSVAP